MVFLLICVYEENNSVFFTILIYQQFTIDKLLVLIFSFSFKTDANWVKYFSSAESEIFWIADYLYTLHGIRDLSGAYIPDMAKYRTMQE